MGADAVPRPDGRERPVSADGRPDQPPDRAPEGLRDGHVPVGTARSSATAGSGLFGGANIGLFATFSQSIVEFLDCTDRDCSMLVDHHFLEPDSSYLVGRPCRWS